MSRKLVAYLIVPGILVLMVFVLVALNSPDRQEGAPPPLAAGVKVMSISSAAFTPVYANTTGWANYVYLGQDQGFTRYFKVPVTLSHGSRILRIGFSFYDNSGLNIRLVLVDHSDRATKTSAISLVSSGAQDRFRKIISPVTPVVIDTLKRGYFLELWLPSGEANYKFVRAYIYYRDAP